MVLWNIGVNKLGPNTSGLFLNFNPIFTAVLAFAFLGEKMTWLQAAGSAIVIAGCFLFTILKHKPGRLLEKHGDGSRVSLANLNNTIS